MKGQRVPVCMSITFSDSPRLWSYLLQSLALLPLAQCSANDKVHGVDTYVKF